MSTFCSLPWVHLASHPDGGVTLCCISDHTNAASRARDFHPLKYYSLNTDKVQDIMNSEFYKKTRLEMLNGIKPQACLRCYKEEEAGVRSKRIEETEKLKFTEEMARAITSENGSIPVNFKFVELRLGNLCNLRCRTCNPNSSSNWVQIYQKIQNELQFVTNYERKIDCSWTESDEFWDDLFNHSSDVELIYVNGGEPTLVEKHWKYLDELIKRGLNKKITLWYNINMTNVPDKLIELWRQFKRVQVTCSIDDLGERNNYLREGSDWNDVISSLDKLQSLGWCEISICQTISWMNVYYMNEFNKFMKNRGLHVHLNYVYDPTFLSVRALPNELKDKVLEKCVDLNDWELNSLKSQLENNTDKNLFQQGLTFNSLLDGYNRKDFEKYFPEWHNLINVYERN